LLKVRLVAYIALTTFFIILIEVTSYLMLNIVQSNYVNLIFQKDTITKVFVENTPGFHPVLGWVPFKEVDGFEARIDSSKYNATEPCMEMYGDSFTWGDQVNKEYAWPTKVGELIKCRVLNFGVSGYGSDQALMRYQGNTIYSEMVILNHLSENIIRNVNQFRNLIFPSKAITLKPRFVIENGSLSYLKAPKFQGQELGNIKHELTADYFVPDGKSGIKSDFTFPYSLSLVKYMINHFHVSSKIKGKPRYMQFYDSLHPSRALDVTVKIIETFLKEAKSRNQIPLITIIPTCRDFEYFTLHGVLTYQPLLDQLKEKKINIFDFMLPIASRKSNFYKLFKNNECKNHYNEEGNKLMAEIFVEHLRALGLQK